MLHLASSKGRLRVLEYLIRKGADVDASARDGTRPLHNAAEFGNPLCVAALVDSGRAEVNSRDQARTCSTHGLWSAVMTAPCRKSQNNGAAGI